MNDIVNELREMSPWALAFAWGRKWDCVLDGAVPGVSIPAEIIFDEAGRYLNEALIATYGPMTSRQLSSMRRDRSDDLDAELDDMERETPPHHHL